MAVIRALLLLLFAQGVAAAPAEADAVQVLTGRIDADEVVIYRLPGLKRGQRLAVHLQATSGNLDPVVGVIRAAVDARQLETLYEEADEIAAARGGDPVAAMVELREKFFLEFDDDGGGGLTAALQFEVPADGEYGLLVAGAQKAAGRETFGNYRLMLGLDREDVLEGTAQPSGRYIAQRNLEVTPPGVGVDQITGVLDGAKPTIVIALQSFKEGDTLYLWLETTEGPLAPGLRLNNFSGKPIKSSNVDGQSRRASLHYTFPADVENYQLQISACCAGADIVGGTFRLLVGINTPAVLSGEAELDGRPVFRRPIEVRTGLRLEQIIEVNQARELFSAVAMLRMQWRDPTLALIPRAASATRRRCMT